MLIQIDSNKPPTMQELSVKCQECLDNLPNGEAGKVNFLAYYLKCSAPTVHKLISANPGGEIHLRIAIKLIAFHKELGL